MSLQVKEWLTLELLFLLTNSNNLWRWTPLRIKWTDGDITHKKHASACGPPVTFAVHYNAKLASVGRDTATRWLRRFVVPTIEKEHQP